MKHQEKREKKEDKDQKEKDAPAVILTAADYDSSVYVKSPFPTAQPASPNSSPRSSGDSDAVSGANFIIKVRFFSVQSASQMSRGVNPPRPCASLHPFFFRRRLSRIAPRLLRSRPFCSGAMVGNRLPLQDESRQERHLLRRGASLVVRRARRRTRRGKRRRASSRRLSVTRSSRVCLRRRFQRR